MSGSASASPSSSRRSSVAAASPAAAAAVKKPPPKKLAKGRKMATPEPLEPVDVPGVVRARLRVEIEALVRPFVPADHPKQTIAFDQRFTFTLPLPPPPQTEDQLAPPGPPQPTVTPPTGVWEPVESAPTAEATAVRWTRTFDARLDRAALLAWEHLHLSVGIEERSLAITPPEPMLHPDGRRMSPAEAEAARAEQAAAELAASKGRRKSSAGSGSARSERGDKEKEKEKEKARKKKEKEKEKEKKERAAKGLPDEPEEPERVSAAHPLLEEEDVPWLPRQTCALHLSPILFAPFSVERIMAQSMDASLCPPGGLLSYTVRVICEQDPMDPLVRLELNPMCITLKRVDNLPKDPLPTWREMNATYKSVTARCAFYSSGTTEIVRPVTPEAERVPPGLHGKELKDAVASAAAAVALAATLPPVPPVVRPVPTPMLQTLPMPHSDSLHFRTQRIIFLGLYDRTALAAQIQSTPLRIELHDRDHRDSRSAEEVAEEARLLELEREAARAAEEAALAKNKKGRKKASGSDTARSNTGRKKTEEKTAEEVVDEPEPLEDEPEDPAQPPSALAHLQFKASSVEAMLADAVLRAAAASKLPSASRVVLARPVYSAAQNVVGVATFGMEDLFRGSTFFELSAPVKPVYPPSHVKLILPQKKIDPYAATPRKHETTIELSVRLSHPYNTQGPMLHETFHRYERAVVAFRYDESLLYQKLLAAIAICNTKALGLVLPGAGSAKARWGGDANANGPPREDVADTGVALLSLGAVRLTLAQQADDSTLDIVCSVQVIDDAQRVFLLEGLSRHHGGRSLATVLAAVGRERENLPHTSKDFFRLLANPSITFPNRIYAGFHAAPKNVRMKAGVTLQSLAKRNAFYVVPKGSSAETYAAFASLFELLSTPKLRVVMRAGLFPSALHLAALEKYFGVFISDQDIFGSVPGLTEADRYDAIKKHQVKTMPDADTPDLAPEIARPRSRGQSRNKAMSRSFNLDLAAIKQAKKDAVREARADAAQQVEIFNALSAEVAQQHNLRHQYDLDLSDTKRFAKTTPAAQLTQDTLSARTTTSIGTTKRTRASDAEVAEEVFVGFRRKEVKAKKASVSADNDAYERVKEEQKQRAASAQFIRQNVDNVARASAKLASTKSPSDYPRYLRPEELGLSEFHVYGGQRNNAYDIQSRLMREQMQAQEARTGKEHHYTYCADYLSASFSKFNLDEEAARRLQADREKWQTADGFRWPAHKTHAESYHPNKDLHEATVEALQHPPDQVLGLAALLDTKGAGLSPSAVQHPTRFRARYVGNAEFGSPDNPDWDTSKDIIGDAAEELARQARLADIAKWKSKIVVDNPNFKVVWTGSGQAGRTNEDVTSAAAERAVQQFNNGRALPVSSRVRGGESAPLPSQPAKVDLYSGMLKDPPVKSGLKFVKRCTDSTGVTFTKNYAVPNVPVSMHAESPFVDHNRTIHMRTLEEKERAELEDTPRHRKPRFAVSAAPPHAPIHRRKIEPGPLSPTTPARLDATLPRLQPLPAVSN